MTGNEPQAVDGALQEIFDDVPFIENEFLLELQLDQENYFKAMERWKSTADLFEKMIDEGLPVEAGHYKFRRVDDERRFEIIDTWGPEDYAKRYPPLTTRQAEAMNGLRAHVRARRDKRNKLLQRFGLPPLKETGSVDTGGV